MYEPMTVEIDRANGEGDYRSYSLYFVGRLIRIVEAGHTKMSLYEWADLGRLLYLVHVEEDKPCLLYTSPSPRDRQKSRMPSSA